MIRPSFALAAGLALVALAHAAGPDPAALVRDYKKLKDLTPHGHQTSIRLSMLCRMVDASDIKAEMKRLGPHAYAEIHVFVDPLAERALKSRAKVFPVGAVLVKEKHVGQASPLGEETKPPLRRNGVTGMIKRAPGFDPKNGDWEYFLQEEGGKLERGKLANCIACHARAKGPDHLFATWWTARRR